jgi:threonylcarbamoyladenosine tRNA methylthiotransferase MtaB
MQKFVVNTFGCKVNQYEGQQIRQLLEQWDLSPINSPDTADIVVVNTCCVTHTASAKSRRCIHKAQKQHPHAIIVVAGCLPPGQPDELKYIKGPVHIVSQKNDLAKTLAGLVQGNCPDTHALRTNQRNACKKSKRAWHHNHPESSKPNYQNNIAIEKCPPNDAKCEFEPLSSYTGKCRAFLKIQDGCDGYCTYCIVPKTRKRLHSKDASVVLQEAYNLIYAGHKEIVLTGIFLGAYGQSTVRRKHWSPAKKDCLAVLVDDVAKLPGLDRLRLSSLEPADVTDALLDVFCKNLNMMPHLHLPLQSGSEQVLRKMRRQYTPEEFTQVVAKARLRLDRPAITTDIIVGFPGETDEDFEKTLEVVRAAKFAKIHVFTYSPRDGTAAARMQPTVKAEVIKRRSAILRDLDKELQAEFRSRFTGERVGVIIEDINPPRGRCERYFMVHLDEKQLTKPVERGQLICQDLQ